MNVVNISGDIFKQVLEWKRQNFKIAFVPTMGNLHAGHLSLVNKAQSVADKVIVSIYVNPMQFGMGEDFDAYPRTIDADKNALIDAGVDLLFLPSNEMMYSASSADTTATTQVFVPGLSEILCGASRPGHFLGVTTIVNKLFNIVQPDIAIFGQKDFQQVAIIQRMVADLFMPVEIVSLPTMREPDGLAMSSRNQYLSAEQRKKAPKLSELLREMSQLVANGADIAKTESKASEILVSAGFEPEYFSFRDPISLSQLRHSQKEMVVLVAAKLGRTRLIDNRLFSCETLCNSA